MINLELKDMELISDKFEKNIDIIEINSKLKNNITKTFKLGIANDEGIKRLVFNYCMAFVQHDGEQKYIFKSDVEYRFIFEDSKDEFIHKLEDWTTEKNNMEDLVIYLDNVTYPYIKEYIENKCKRANVEVKLPFEFREDN